MIYIRNVLTRMALAFLFTLVSGCASAQTDQVDYLWFVDVSGHRNIYIEGIQHSIDSFYIEASKHDRLRVYNFAADVVPVGEQIDNDNFYKYSDLSAVLYALDSLVSTSQSKYVRAFILSDFHHADSVNGNVALSPDSLREVREAIATHSFDKNVKFYLMVIPPSARYNGYSLHAIQAILPFGSSEVFGVTPDNKTTAYMLSKVYELNALRGIDDKEVQKIPLVAIIVIIVVMVNGLIVWLYLRKRRKDKVNTIK